MQMVLPSPCPGSEPRQHCPLEHSVMIDYFSFYNFLYFLKHAYIILTERGEKINGSNSLSPPLCRPENGLLEH